MTAGRRRLGQAGERRAARWYEARGYRVLAANWQASGGQRGEIDLVLRRGHTLVFCEVKTRTSLAFGTPAEAVTPVKQLRLRRLAGAWLRASGERAAEIRFDVAAVLPGSVEVIEAAF